MQPLVHPGNYDVGLQ